MSLDSSDFQCFSFVFCVSFILFGRLAFCCVWISELLMPDHISFPFPFCFRLTKKRFLEPFLFCGSLGVSFALLLLLLPAKGHGFWIALSEDQLPTPYNSFQIEFSRDSSRSAITYGNGGTRGCMDYEYCYNRTSTEEFRVCLALFWCWCVSSLPNE